MISSPSFHTKFQIPGKTIVIFPWCFFFVVVSVVLGNGRWENLMACKLGNYQLIAGLTTLLNMSCGLLTFLGHLEFKVVSLNSLAVSHVGKKCVSASWHLSLVSLPVNQL